MKHSSSRSGRTRRGRRRARPRPQSAIHRPDGPHRPAVWIGDADHAEFCWAVKQLSAQTKLASFRDIGAAIDALLPVANMADFAASSPTEGSPTERQIPSAGSSDRLAGVCPELIVLAQSRPAQYAQADVARIGTAAPLARLVTLLGSWCEGETRTGQPWPGVQRVYWHQWPARLYAHWLSPPPGAAIWNHPRTRTPVEQFLHAADQPLPVGGLRQVGIVAQRPVNFEGLRGVCRTMGLESCRLAPHPAPLPTPAPDAIVWDCEMGALPQAETIRRWRRDARVRVVALMSFPRQNDVDQAVSAGVDATLSKPFLLEDFFTVLNSASNRSA